MESESSGMIIKNVQTDLTERGYLIIIGFRYFVGAYATRELPARIGTFQ